MPAVALVAGAVVGGLASNAASKRQVSASENAQRQNTTAAQDGVRRIEDSTSQAIETVKGGQIKNESIIRESAQKQIDFQNDAFARSKQLMIDGGLEAQKKIAAARDASLGAISAGVGLSLDAIRNSLATSTARLEQGRTTGRNDIISARDASNANFQPVVDAGNRTLPGLESLITDPNAQREFITDNAFFKSLADDAQSRLMANQAAKGKVGSGGTASALQTSLLNLGQGLLDNNIAQRFGLVDRGMQAANSIGTINMNAGNSLANLEQGTAQNIANLTTNAGMAESGVHANAAAQNASLINSAGTNIAGLEVSTRNNIANQINSTANNKTNIIDLAGSRLVDLNNTSTNNIAGLQSGLGTNSANILTGNAANNANLITGAGDAAAAGTVGIANSINSGINNYLNYDAYNKYLQSQNKA